MGYKPYDLRSELRFYKWYHHNPVNAIIHSIFVPSILFTSMCLLSAVPLSFFSFKINLTQFLTIYFSAFYILLDKPVGILATGILILANTIIMKHSELINIKINLIIFGLSWIFQFIGPGIFEKRKPALVDNVIQSLVMAPYFILFEAIFICGGYQSLRRQLPQDIEEMEKEAKLNALIHC
ncbi:hypothetical protein TBLA_0C04090 [Henningerozyma blattae CBS 6284]|uniref:DUF962 domain-containing protein n=1 Tax=Henningerozyma blattae (strain ATCC 34711 / CBS 6284 / DSM 70876 / NBRC 10599 / NRRL Y-10934 / UCD 77-7) TaxID=1071380 RepID=I2H1F7_HENB6|nr:hypothetical protein TBLA_0C04090 [Tetrapisispora blattae CBS 6284]CCH60209.1 hypothetical protein TBLA_0C04090 [Tetrapisispora blattae CBS 6284]